MKTKKRILNIIGFLLIGFALSQAALADSSASFKIDTSTLNGGGGVSNSSSFRLNDTLPGLVNGQSVSSAAYAMGSGQVYLEVLCGNGILEEGELCDDGNLVSGDGCSATCQTEVPAPPPPVTPPPPAATGGGGGGKTAPIVHQTCGNHVREGSEQCDDGNKLSGDGCSKTCLIEKNVVLKPAAPKPVCGNGKLENGEACDDGNTLSGDGCAADCSLEPRSESYPPVMIAQVPQPAPGPVSPNPAPPLIFNVEIPPVTPSPPDNTPPKIVLENVTRNGGEGIAVQGGVIRFTIEDTGSGVDLDNLRVIVNGVPYTIKGDHVFHAAAKGSGYEITIGPLDLSTLSNPVHIVIQARDKQGNQVTEVKYDFSLSLQPAPAPLHPAAVQVPFPWWIVLMTLCLTFMIRSFGVILMDCGKKKHFRR